MVLAINEYKWASAASSAVWEGGGQSPFPSGGDFNAGRGTSSSLWGSVFEVFFRPAPQRVFEKCVFVRKTGSFSIEAGVHDLIKAYICIACPKKNT